MSDFLNFRIQALKARGPRKHRITNSYGVYDAYKWLRRQKWPGIGTPVKEHEFYTILRTLNTVMSDIFIQDGRVSLPENLGDLMLLKKQNRALYKDGKLIVTYPVDWDSTLQLWFEDPEARENKTLVRYNNKYKPCYFYNKNKAKYKNKLFYSFKMNRGMKSQAAKNLFGGSLDALLKYG